MPIDETLGYKNTIQEEENFHQVMLNDVDYAKFHSQQATVIPFRHFPHAKFYKLN